MNEHTPRLWKTLLLLGLGSLIVGGLVYLQAPEYVWIVGVLFGVILVAFAGFEIVLIAYQHGNERERIYNDRIKAIALCPPDRLNALGYHVPQLGFKVIDNFPVPMWSLDPPITLDAFREFLTGCKEDYIVPVREFGRGEEDVRQRELILKVLLDRGYVVSRAEGGAPRGPRSWIFRQDARARLFAEWMTWDIEVIGLDASEMKN